MKELFFEKNSDNQIAIKAVEDIVKLLDDGHFVFAIYKDNQNIRGFVEENHAGELLFSDISDRIGHEKIRFDYLRDYYYVFSGKDWREVVNIVASNV